MRRDVERLCVYLLQRLGQEIVYKRFKETAYDWRTGGTASFWEQVNTKAIITEVEEESIRTGGGIFQRGDKRFTVLSSVFSSQAADDPGEPGLGDEIELDGEKYRVDLAGTAVVESDPTGTLLDIYARKVEA